MGRAYLAIMAVTVLWATNFTAGKIGTREIDPLFIASFRILATAAVFIALLPREQRRFDRAEVRAVLPLALTGIVANHLCFAAGIKLTTPSHSAILHALIPVFVATLAWLLIRERMGPLGIVGMALAVAGALIVVLGASREELRGKLAGDVLTTVGVFAFSFYTVIGRRVVATMGGMRTIALAFALGIPFTLPLLAWGAARQDWGAVTWKGWAALAYMLVAGNLLAYSLHIYALSKLTAGRVAVFTALQPAIGIGVALLAGEDRATGPLLAGASVALAGVVLVQFRRRAE